MGGSIGKSSCLGVDGSNFKDEASSLMPQIPTTTTLARDLSAREEQVRLHAAYCLAEIGRGSAGDGGDSGGYAQVLTEALISKRPEVRFSAMHGAAAMGSTGLPHLLHVADLHPMTSLGSVSFAIGGILSGPEVWNTAVGAGTCSHDLGSYNKRMGIVEDAFKLLIRISHDTAAEPWARRNAIEALGIASAQLGSVWNEPLGVRVDAELNCKEGMSSPWRNRMALEVAEALAQVVNGSVAGGDLSLEPARRGAPTVLGGSRISSSHLEYQRRFMAALSLAQLGTLASTHANAIPVLVATVQSDFSVTSAAAREASPYMMAYAMEALRRVGGESVAALRALTDVLLDERWCLHTSPDAPF